MKLACYPLRAKLWSNLNNVLWRPNRNKASIYFCLEAVYYRTFRQWCNHSITKSYSFQERRRKNNPTTAKTHSAIENGFDVKEGEDILQRFGNAQVMLQLFLISLIRLLSNITREHLNVHIKKFIGQLGKRMFNNKKQRDDILEVLYQLEEIGVDQVLIC